jgi:hypothetical protein
MSIYRVGFLEKKNESLFPQWHRHWFVLNDGCLYYFKNRTDDGPRCIIPLENTKISKGSTPTELVISSASGELLKSSKLLETGGMELGKHTKFILCADTESERDAWVKALKEECNRIKPLHEIFLRKKDYVSLALMKLTYFSIDSDFLNMYLGYFASTHGCASSDTATLCSGICIMHNFVLKEYMLTSSQYNVKLMCLGLASETYDYS